MRVTVDTDEVMRALKGLAKQAPFVTSRALNTTAREVVNVLRLELGQTMSLRNTWTAGGIRQENSTTRHLVAEVGSLDPYMEAQAEAGPRRMGMGARGSGGGTASQAVPTKALRPSPGTKIKRAKLPGRLLQKPEKYFIARVGGATILWQRFARKAPRALWIFKRVVQLPESGRWPLAETAERVVRLTWDAQVADAVAYALRTIRR